MDPPSPCSGSSQPALTLGTSTLGSVRFGLDDTFLRCAVMLYSVVCLIFWPDSEPRHHWYGPPQLHVPSDLGVEVDLIDGITQGNPDAGGFCFAWRCITAGVWLPLLPGLALPQLFC